MTGPAPAAKATRRPRHLLIFAVTVLVTMLVAAPAYTYFYPRLVYGALQKVIVRNGLGSGSGIPPNTLFTVSDLASPTTAKANVLIDGTNHDTLYTVGWLDLSAHAEELHVPDMHGRYYSIEFIDPDTGDVFAYVGRRTTGTDAGTFLITGPGTRGSTPGGVKTITAPNTSVLLIGRTLATSDSDVATAYDLAKQIHLTPAEDR
ncbi:MAG: DUF1254 domain-containing protein [Arachnia sp.]